MAPVHHPGIGVAGTGVEGGLDGRLSGVELAHAVDHRARSSPVDHARHDIGSVPYARHVATASPSPTPNPDAMKFTLDTTLPEMLNVASPDAAAGMPFAEAVFAAGGVASIFGVNDFVTVTRQPGVDWDPIVAAVVAAAAEHL